MQHYDSKDGLARVLEKQCELFTQCSLQSVVALTKTSGWIQGFGREGYDTMSIRRDRIMCVELRYVESR